MKLLDLRSAATLPATSTSKPSSEESGNGIFAPSFAVKLPQTRTKAAVGCG